MPPSSSACEPHVGLNFHTHLEGCVRPETAADLARTMDVPEPTGGWDAALRMKEPADLTVFLAHVAAAYPVLGSPDAMRRVAREAVEDATADGCDFLEMRFGPATHARAGFSIPQVIAAACEGLEDGRRATGLAVGLVVCLLRHSDDETNLAVARAAAAAAGNGVVGLDVAGDEILFPSLGPYREPYAIASAAGLGLTAHAAEAAPGAAAVEAVATLGVTRIGHGSHIADDPADAGVGGRGRDRDRGLPDLERPDRRRTFGSRASVARVPRRRLPRRSRRRQPDQHREPDHRRGEAPGRGGWAHVGAGTQDPRDGVRRRVHRRIHESGRSGSRGGQAGPACVAARRRTRPSASRRSSATRSPCSGPSPRPDPQPAAIGPPPSSRRRAEATGSSHQWPPPLLRAAPRAPIGERRRRCRTARSRRRLRQGSETPESRGRCARSG